MRLQTRSVCLILSPIIAGSLLVSWDMKVYPVVTVPRGQDAVLSCSFTHPRQQDYQGTITVKWLARDSWASPFFSCSVRNGSVDEVNDCSESGLKHSLRGDPRRGELSLLIRKVHVTDDGTYFCRVELDGWMSYSQRETRLYVTVKPQILSLSVVETSSGSDSATRSLQCEVEGHPLPTVTWLSASRSLSGDQVRTSQVGPDRLLSQVPYLQEDVFTCRAESRLGGAERTFPASQSLMISLTVCGLVVLLLLLLLSGFICCRRNTARPESSPVCEDTDPARADTSPVYGNAAVVETHRLQGSDCPAEGDAELQLLYCALGPTSQHAAFRSCTRRREETGVVYSPVNVE